MQQGVALLLSLVLLTSSSTRTYDSLPTSSLLHPVQDSIEEELSTEEMLSAPSLLSDIFNFLAAPPILSQVFPRNTATVAANQAIDEALQLLPDFPCSLSSAIPKSALEVDIHSLPLSLQLQHPTLQLIKSRLEVGSKPGQRKDGFKLGLAVEGGGMRGVLTGGMLMGIYELGMRHAFDAVYGSSAGAINATYFLSGQPHGLDVYADDISNERFLDFKRIIGPDPVMNLDFLVDYVMNEVKPLDFGKVLNSPIPLKVVASSLDSLDSFILQNFSTPRELAEALKASATVPEFAGGPKLISGHRLVDAAVFEPVPYQAAIRDGCTHVLALCSNTPTCGAEGPVQQVVKKFMNAAVGHIINNPPYMKEATHARLEEERLNGGLTQSELMLMAMIQGLKGWEPSAVGGQVSSIHPPSEVLMSPSCTDPPTLRVGAEEGRRSVRRVLEALVSDMPA
ncbi:unnamed protein product [Ostreobium quekettii]|uniref:Patatin n=1 Tax=Ostreobium quekettii TaxID=121088 RepID=A0A8S1J9K7_9CHLO|nr:unnamed protein product [Ostreobium quekettii]|eukprot:evm.model.scf_1630.8 EVM.evm.TU.scf_1630.8   scf_1630:34538-36377(-)